MTTTLASCLVALVLAADGYLGLACRDIPGGHTVVSWMFPGPLDGKGLAAPEFDLARPDLLVSVNGETMGAEAFRSFIRSQAPGTTIEIATRKSRRRGGGIPDDLDHEDDVRTITVTLASRADWCGTVGEGRGHTNLVAYEEGERLLDPDDEARPLGRAFRSEGIVDPVKNLLAIFPQWRKKADDFHELSRVLACFEDPFRLPEIERLVTDPARRAPDAPIETALTMMRENLDAPPPRPFGAMAWPVADETDVADTIFEALHEASLDLAIFLGDVEGDVEFARRCLDFLRVPRETFYIEGPSAASHIVVMRRSMTLRFGQLAPALAHLGALGRLEAPDLPEGDPAPPTDDLDGAVEGDVLLARRHERLGWVVVGGPGPNRYDMSRVSAVIDPGGDDEYHATGLALGCRVIIDLAGDDRYTGTKEQGPAAALLGAVFVDDRAGDDRYEGGFLSTGAAMYGAALLVDRAGNDVYEGSEWSIGAGVYGAGMIVDLGTGNDTYLGDFLCEGVGGPRGYGCIVDAGGRDLYRANGPTPSAYGTPAVYQSFSQGMGFGYRNYAAGGIGLISDLGGDDRYECGEFGQGGAYYHGLGVLHDAGGRDLYYGNRYGQGFGVHQAFGVLADDGGDDTYWSMTAASQGAAWDVGAGLLIDRAGDDTYQCDGLGQGGASMQAIGMLVDLGGADRYVAARSATQGGAGGNSYHFAETGVFSLGLLLDLGGDRDRYSGDRKNDVVRSSGDLREEGPRDSTLHGLFVDE